jgi:hypothetical protein
MSAVALYRDYELPWAPSEEKQPRLRRVLGAVLGLFIAFGVIIPLLPEREKSVAPLVVPERVVEFPARAAEANAEIGPEAEGVE